MSKLFDLNNPLMRGLTDIFNLILLSVLWLICCIPVVTIGPATAALYYVVQKMLRLENRGILRCFFGSFRENLKQGILLTLILGVAAAVMYYDFIFSYMVGEALGTALRVVFAIMAAVWLMVVCYAFPLQAQFQNSVRNTLKNALLLSLVHLGKTLQLMILHLIPVAVCLLLPELFGKLLPFWLFAAPGLIAYFSSLRMKKVYASLLEQAQGDTEEDTPEEEPAEEV